MGEMSRIERLRAASETRDAVANRPAGATTAAREAAMRRYLSAEKYHELRQEQDPQKEPRQKDEAGAGLIEERRVP